MLQQSMNWKGFVKTAVIGARTEDFLNLCASSGIEIRNIERRHPTTLICHINLADTRLLRRILRETGCRVRFMDRYGFPFFLQKAGRRLGIIAGLLFFTGILLILSNMVWHIDVNGADPQLEEEIRSLLRQEHLYVGSLDFFVPDPGKLESGLSAKLPRVTWIGLSKNGTAYQVDVVQKKYPEEQKPSGPRNLVASKQAVIHHWVVENGQVVVESDQFVKPGQTLVLGRIGREDDPKFVSASGEVIGETWYRSEASIPLEGAYTVYTGESDRHHRLDVWGLSVPLWGFGKKSEKTFDKEVVTRPIRFFLWELPVSYRHTLYREKRVVHRNLTEKEALEEARDAADKKLLNQLPKNARIMSATLEDQHREKGKLNIRIQYVVLENIARPQAIDPVKVREELNERKKKAEE